LVKLIDIIAELEPLMLPYQQHVVLARGYFLYPVEFSKMLSEPVTKKVQQEQFGGKNCRHIKGL